jgi:hypothetical protein
MKLNCVYAPFSFIFYMLPQAKGLLMLYSKRNSNAGLPDYFLSSTAAQRHGRAR